MTLCPACGGPTTGRRLRLDRSVLARCARCGHAVTVAAPASVRAEAYGGSLDARRRYERVYLPAREAAWTAALAELAPADGQRLLDVGANYGHFLSLALGEGWDAYGFEPGDGLRAHAVPGSDGRLFATLEAAAARGPFAVVTLWDVLEHIDEPGDLLARLADLLTGDGLVAVRVPDTRVLAALEASPPRRLLAPAYLKLCHPINPEEHPHHFTPESLERIAGAAGLRAIDSLRSGSAERVVAAATVLDLLPRHALAHWGARLPYEFTMFLSRAV